MCGISGIFSSSGQTIDSRLIFRMTDTLRHRGPDDRGVYINGNISLGMNRLAIIDLSRNAHQPMSNEDGTVRIVFNGEIYNHDLLRDELTAKGHRYKSGSDTESIVHLYEEYGVDCLNKLNGMFAFAIWDSLKERLFIARDRLGIKPLYYTRKDGHFCFASEMKAILCLPYADRQIDFRSMDQYLSYGVVPHPGTIYKNISSLEPGHYLLVENSSVTKRRYWSLNEKLNGNGSSADNSVSEAEYIDEIYSRLKKAVKLRLMSDVPLGVFLSGGIDSSLVTALMSEVSGRAVQTFSVGFEDGDPDMNELNHCRVISKRYETDHHEFVQTSNTESILLKIAGHFDEPFANPTSIPMYHISSLASENVTVALSGVGGDELFCGYPRHLAAQWFQYSQMIPAALRHAALSAAAKLRQSPSPYSSFDRFRRFLSLEAGTDASMYEDLRSIFSTAQKKQLYSGVLKQELSEVGNNELHFIEESFRNAFGETAVNRALFTDLMTYLPTDLLTYCDRMSMAASLEMRVPFCDHEFVEFSMSIPLKQKTKQFQLKYLLKKVASKVLPKEIIYRKKQGFATEQVGISAIVQKMVDSNSAGVMFTASPTGDESKILIEAAFGLGEAVVSGSVTPDTYVVDKGSMKIEDKRIARQEFRIVRQGRENVKRFLGENQDIKDRIAALVKEKTGLKWQRKQVS